MKEEKLKYIYSKYDNINKPNFKRKDSKQTKVILLIKDYFNHHSLLTKDKFNEFLTFIDLKSIWSTKEEQNILWNSLLSYSSNKISIDYNAAMKGILENQKSLYLYLENAQIQIIQEILIFFISPEDIHLSPFLSLGYPAEKIFLLS